MALMFRRSVTNLINNLLLLSPADFCARMNQAVSNLYKDSTIVNYDSRDVLT